MRAGDWDAGSAPPAGSQSLAEKLELLTVKTKNELLTPEEKRSSTLPSTRSRSMHTPRLGPSSVRGFSYTRAFGAWAVCTWLVILITEPTPLEGRVSRAGTIAGRNQGGFDRWEELESSSSMVAERTEKLKLLRVTNTLCPPGCEAHGNCDESTGNCQCPLGRGGPDCSQSEVPECQLTFNVLAPCTPYVPRSCGCLKQCMHLAARHGLAIGGGVCYNVSTPEERAAVVHAPAKVAGKALWADVRRTGCSIEEGLAMEATLKPISTALRGFKEWLPVLERLPVQECTGECGQRGFCLKSSTCRCYNGGRHCGKESFSDEISRGAPRDAICPGGCSGRGVCQGAGFCRCLPGHWGIDCALSLDNSTGAARLWDGYTPGAEVSPRVYVYDYGAHPIHMNNAFFGGHNRWQGDYNRITESLLRERLLSSRHRTLDPDAADFFYISNPLSTCAHEAIKEVLRLPYFKRRGGRDHLMYTALDRGTDEMFANSPCWRDQPRSDGTALPDLIKGISFVQHMGQRVGTRSQGLRGDGNFREDRDILLPPLQHPPGRILLRFSPYFGSPEAVRQSSSRTGDLFFAGSVNMKDKGEKGPINVRREIFQKLMGKPGFALHKKLESADQYYGNMTSNRFCLAPPGTSGGWGRRTTLVALFGCIPVIVQDGRINEPFAELFAPESYSVRVAEKDIPRMGEILRGLSQGQIERMQRELACLWPRWMYSSVKGATGDEGVEDDVFAGLMMLLRRRLEGKKKPLASACDVLSPALKDALRLSKWSNLEGGGDRGFGEAMERASRRREGKWKRSPGVLCRERDCMRLDANRQARWGERLFEAGLLSKRPVVNTQTGMMSPAFLKLKVAPGGAACVGQDNSGGPPC